MFSSSRFLTCSLAIPVNKALVSELVHLPKPKVSSLISKKYILSIFLKYLQALPSSFVYHQELAIKFSWNTTTLSFYGLPMAACIAGVELRSCHKNHMGHKAENIYFLVLPRDSLSIQPLIQAVFYWKQKQLEIGNSLPIENRLNECSTKIVSLSSGSCPTGKLIMFLKAYTTMRGTLQSMKTLLGITSHILGLPTPPPHLYLSTLAPQSQWRQPPLGSPIHRVLAFHGIQKILLPLPWRLFFYLNLPLIQFLLTLRDSAQASPPPGSLSFLSD